MFMHIFFFCDKAIVCFDEVGCLLAMSLMVAIQVIEGKVGLIMSSRDFVRSEVKGKHLFKNDVP